MYPPVIHLLPYLSTPPFTHTLGLAQHTERAQTMVPNAGFESTLQASLGDSLKLSVFQDIQNHKH